jgi:hypothetical protein
VLRNNREASFDAAVGPTCEALDITLVPRMFGRDRLMRLAIIARFRLGLIAK